MFKSLFKFELIGVEDLPTKIEIYSQSIDIALLKDRTGKITWNALGDIVGNCSNLGNGALLTINGYALGIIWGKNYFVLFDLHRKNSNGNISQNGTSVLLKFETLNKLQEYIKDIYYVGLKHETLYFQIQFINLLCSSEEIKVIKSNVGLEGGLSF